MFRALYTILLVSALTSIAAQPVPFSKKDFFLTGDALQLSGPCFQLTEAKLWQGGAIWYNKAIDLSDPLELEIDLNFGCKDEFGADGMVFILHPKLTTGYAGEGMGFGRLFPSFGIEMDTYENYHLSDPPFDHVAFMKHGQLHHHYGVTEPVYLSSKNRNVEDCKNHRVKINWNPEEELMSFYFEGNLRIQKKIDLVKDIFDGDPNVYWGFSSATGGMVNKHLVCLEEMLFTVINTLSKKDRDVLTNGGVYTFNEFDFNFGSYTLPEESHEEIDRLIPFLQKDKSKTIILNGYTDSSGDEFQNKNLSKKRAKAINEYLISKGIEPKRIIYNGFGEVNPVAPNDTEEGRKKNRRVEMKVVLLKV